MAKHTLSSEDGAGRARAILRTALEDGMRRARAILLEDDTGRGRGIPLEDSAGRARTVLSEDSAGRTHALPSEDGNTRSPIGGWRRTGPRYPPDSAGRARTVLSEDSARRTRAILSATMPLRADAASLPGGCDIVGASARRPRFRDGSDHGRGWLRRIGGVDGWGSGGVGEWAACSWRQAPRAQKHIPLEMWSADSAVIGAPKFSECS